MANFRNVPEQVNVGRGKVASIHLNYDELAYK